MSSTAKPAAEPLILCALEFERRALRRTGIAALAQIQCTGPGSAAIARWFSKHRPDRNAVVILAGLAGALEASLPTGSAHRLAAVIDAEGHRWNPSLGASNEASREVIATSSPRTLANPEMKDRFKACTTAGLVDLESVAFASRASERGLRWAIIRGVSDGPDDSLPRDIDEWVDDRGRVRAGVVVRAALRRPRVVRVMMELRARSARAMEAAAAELRAMLSHSACVSGSLSERSASADARRDEACRAAP